LSSFRQRFQELIYKHPERNEYWSFADSSEEIVERDGCYGSGSVIAGWRDRPLPPTKRAEDAEAIAITTFAGVETERFVRTDDLTGWVDGFIVNETHSGVTVAGWAMDLKRLSPATHLALMEDEKVVAVFSAGTLRPDIIEAYSSKDAGYSGFYKVLPEQALGKGRIRVFAFNDSDQFCELNYSEQAQGYINGRTASSDPVISC
jgi:hypothetical protein